jgi:hypothetical protein
MIDNVSVNFRHLLTERVHLKLARSERSSSLPAA